MERPRISVAIIALNEAAQITSLLGSLSFADEIILVDGGSSDDTVALACADGAKVFQRTFDQFAKQRNFAIEQCHGDWILSIDADERPTRRLVEELENCVSDSRFAAYRVPIRSNIFGRRVRFGGTQNDRPVRLFRRGAAMWQGEVHEVLKVRGKIGRLAGWLDHYTLPNLPSFLKKMHHYTTLAAESRLSQGHPPRTINRWLAPVREVFRRLIWKHGWLDGPAGWSFALLSGLSEWVLADKHQQLWNQREQAQRQAMLEGPLMESHDAQRSLSTPHQSRAAISTGPGLISEAVCSTR